MYVGMDWDPLEASESDTFSIELTADLNGATVTSQQWFCAVVATQPGATTDASPAARVLGGPSATTSADTRPYAATGATRTFANQMLGGGCVAGNKYRAGTTVVLSDGRQITRYSHFWCVAET